MSSNAEEFQIEQQTTAEMGQARQRIRDELAKVIVGQDVVIDQLLISLFSGGHWVAKAPISYLSQDTKMRLLPCSISGTPRMPSTVVMFGCRYDSARTK